MTLNKIYFPKVKNFKIFINLYHLSFKTKTRINVQQMLLILNYHKSLSEKLSSLKAKF